MGRGSSEARRACPHTVSSRLVCVGGRGSTNGELEKKIMPDIGGWANGCAHGGGGSGWVGGGLGGLVVRVRASAMYDTRLLVSFGGGARRRE